MLVKDYMDTCVKAINLHTSLFDVIQEIEDRDYIVVKDSNDEIIGIVTASDLARRFERFSRTFAHLGEIDLRLRNCFRSEGIELGRPLYAPGFKEYIDNLTQICNVIKDVADPQQFSRDLCHVKSIRDRIMHFRGGKLEEANDEDIEALVKVLVQLREFEQP